MLQQLFNRKKTLIRPHLSENDGGEFDLGFNQLNAAKQQFRRRRNYLTG
jgi:hypothetical protein